MARPLRIEFPGAIYHVTSRGNRREPIFVDDVDRDMLLSVVATELSRFDVQALAYCLMGNHDHFGKGRAMRFLPDWTSEFRFVRQSANANLPRRMLPAATLR